MDRPRPVTELPPLKGETTVVAPDRLERAIARRVAETRATIPDSELATDVAADAALTLARERGWSLTALLVRACASSLRECPRANGAYRDGRFELYSRVNIGVVIPTRDGQVTPTVLDADTKSPAELDAELTRLTARARAGELTPPELAGPTFTLSDLGDTGVRRPGAFLHPPQAAALAAGAVHEVAAVRGGELVAGHELSLSLACDHRILYGARAAGFLARVAELLSHPEP